MKIIRTTREKKSLAISVFDFIIRNENYFLNTKFYSAQGVIYISNKMGKTNAEIQSVFNLVGNTDIWKRIIEADAYVWEYIKMMREYCELIKVRNRGK